MSASGSKLSARGSKFVSEVVKNVVNIPTRPYDLLGHSPNSDYESRDVDEDSVFGSGALGPDL